MINDTEGLREDDGDEEYSMDDHEQCEGCGAWLDPPEEFFRVPGDEGSVWCSESCHNRNGRRFALGRDDEIEDDF